MNFDDISYIAERFLLDTYANVRSVRIIHIGTASFGATPVYKVDCVASMGTGKMRGVGAGIRVEVTVDKDGRVVAVHGRLWHRVQRSHENLRAIRRSRYTE